jgi:hypothetical protein
MFGLPRIIVRDCIPLLLIALGSPSNAVAASLQSRFDQGGHVEIPAGTHRITEPLVIDLAETGWISASGHGVARLVMAGPGPAIRILGPHDGTANPQTVNPNVWEQERMPLIDGIEIIGAHPEANGIEAKGTMQLTVSRVNLRQLQHGIHLVDRNRNILISESHIYENHGIGIYLDDVNLHQINVSHCHSGDSAGGGIVKRRGEVRGVRGDTCDLGKSVGGPDSTPTDNIHLGSRNLLRPGIPVSTDEKIYRR